jgi:hypothetical protein
MASKSKSGSISILNQRNAQKSFVNSFVSNRRIGGIWGEITGSSHQPNHSPRRAKADNHPE